MDEKNKKPVMPSEVITYRVSRHIYQALAAYAATQTNDMGNILSVNDVARKLMMGAFAVIPREMWESEHGTTIRTPNKQEIEAKRQKTLAAFAAKRKGQK